MFPHCKVSLSGLIPCAKYILLVDMVPEDGFRYKVRQQLFSVSHIKQQPCITTAWLLAADNPQYFQHLQTDNPCLLTPTPTP